MLMVSKGSGKLGEMESDTLRRKLKVLVFAGKSPQLRAGFLRSGDIKWGAHQVSPGCESQRWDIESELWSVEQPPPGESRSTRVGISAIYA
jgi:hypothetical protein